MSFAADIRQKSDYGIMNDVGFRSKRTTVWPMTHSQTPEWLRRFLLKHTYVRSNISDHINLVYLRQLVLCCELIDRVQMVCLLSLAE